MKAIIVIADGTVLDGEVTGLEDLQARVGGWIEAIGGRNEHGAWTGYCNEEGKLDGLPVNREATLLATRAGWYGAGADVLCGTVVFLGPVDSNGDETDVAESIRAYLPDTESSVSRQHFIDTGMHLTRAEVREAQGAATTRDVRP